jgi:hypothetical protein
VIYPGPAAIDMNQCPGGLVVHIYSVPDEVLLLVSSLTGGNVETQGLADGDLIDKLSAGTVCLVFYDGDTGLRMPPPPEWPPGVPLPL